MHSCPFNWQDWYINHQGSPYNPSVFALDLLYLYISVLPTLSCHAVWLRAINQWSSSPKPLRTFLWWNIGTKYLPASYYQFPHAWIIGWKEENPSGPHKSQFAVWSSQFSSNPGHHVPDKRSKTSTHHTCAQHWYSTSCLVVNWQHFHNFQMHWLVF